MKNIPLIKKVSVQLFLWIALSNVLANEPPVIAVGAFRNVDYKAHKNEHQFAVLGDLISSELSQRYDCRICNRSSGYDASLEHDKKVMTDLIQSSAASPQIQQAEYVVGGLIRANGANLDCVIRTLDLSDTNLNVQEIVVTTNFLPHLVEELPAIIAEELRLVPKVSHVQVAVTDPMDTELVWVVLPFAVHNKARSYQSGANDFRGYDRLPIENELTIRMEESLQQVAKGIPLVDHASLQAILQEHQLSWLNGKTGGDADTALARLVGADRIVIGAAARFPGAWRVVVSVVDAHSGIVLGSVTHACASLDQLKADMPVLCENLISEVDRPLKFVAADSAMRLREAEFYLRQAGIKDPPLTQVTPASYGETVIANCQAAYLLSRDDPVMVYRIASYLIDRIMRPAYWYDYGDRAGFLNPKCYRSLLWDFAPGFSNMGKHRAARVAQDLFEGIEDSANTPSPLLQRARLAIYEKDYARALEYVETHRAALPKKNWREVKIMLARIYLETGRYSESLEIVEELKRKYLRTKEVNKIHTRLLEQMNSDEDMLKMLEQRGVYSTMYAPEYFSKYVPLLRKIRGPQAALDYLDTVSGFDLRYFIYQSERAYTYHLLGMTNEAFKGYEVLRQRDDLDGSYPAVDDALFHKERNLDSFKQLRNLYGDQKRERGMPDDFRLPCDLITFTNGTLYLLRTTKADQVFLERVAAQVSKALAVPVKVLPAVAADEKMLDTSAEAIKYNACALAESMVRESEIPDDALFVICVTSDYLSPDGNDGRKAYSSKRSFVHSDYNDNVAIATYRIWDSAEPDGKIMDFVTRQTAKVISALFVKQVTEHKCNEYPCLMRMMTIRGANKQPRRFFSYLRYALCPECQKQYTQENLALFQRRYQDYVRQLRNDSSM